MDWQQIASFTLIALVVEISPGPNFALVTKSVSSGGRTAGLANIPGFSLAFLLHGTLSIFGVAALLKAAPGLLLIMQLVGALYLLYLGLQPFTAQTLPRSDAELDTSKSPLLTGIVSAAQGNKQTPHSIFRDFADGLLTNCLNPKISLFYYAVFPQITAQTDNVEFTSYLLVVIHILLNAIWFFMVATVLGRILRHGSKKLEQLIGTVSGIVLIGFSIAFAAGVAQAI